MPDELGASAFIKSSRDFPTGRLAGDSDMVDIELLTSIRVVGLPVEGQGLRDLLIARLLSTCCCGIRGGAGGGREPVEGEELMKSLTPSPVKSKQGSCRSSIELLVMLSAVSGWPGNCCRRDTPRSRTLNCSLESRVSLTGAADGEQMAHITFRLKNEKSSSKSMQSTWHKQH